MIVLVGVLVVAVDWGEVLAVVRDMSVGWLVMYALVILTGIAISAYKWGQIAQIGGFDNSYKQYFWWYYSGVFLNNFFPGFLGGDTYRTVALAGEKKQFAQASVTVIFDRITGLAAFLVLGVVGGVVAWVVTSAAIYALVALVMVAGCAIVVGVFVLRKWIGAHRRVPKVLRKYLEVFGVYGKSSLTSALGYSVAFALIGVALANYLLFVAAGVSLSPILYLALIFPINIAIALPLSIGNIGTKEWAYIVIFGIIGVTSETALAVVIVGRLLQMLISLAAAPMVLRKR